MATATATACSRGSQGRKGKREPEEGESGPEGVGRMRGWLWVSPWRHEDVGEAATTKQEVEARASPALATEQLRGEGEEDDREEEVGWAAGGAGPAGKSGKWLGFSLFFKFLFCFIFFFCFVFI